ARRTRLVRRHRDRRRSRRGNGLDRAGRQRETRPGAGGGPLSALPHRGVAAVGHRGPDGPHRRAGPGRAGRVHQETRRAMGVGRQPRAVDGLLQGRPGHAVRLRLPGGARPVRQDAAGQRPGARRRRARGAPGRRLHAAGRRRRHRHGDLPGRRRADRDGRGPLDRRRVRPGWHRDPPAAQPGLGPVPEEPRGVELLEGRHPAAGGGRGQHLPADLRRGLVVVHPAARRRHQHRRGGGQLRAGEAPRRRHGGLLHRRAGTDPGAGRAAGRGAAGGGAAGRPGLVVRLRPVRRRRVRGLRRRGLLHRPAVLHRRAPGDAVRVPGGGVGEHRAGPPGGGPGQGAGLLRERVPEGVRPAAGTGLLPLRRPRHQQGLVLLARPQPVRRARDRPPAGVHLADRRRVRAPVLVQPLPATAGRARAAAGHHRADLRRQVDRGGRGPAAAAGPLGRLHGRRGPGRGRRPPAAGPLDPDGRRGVAGTQPAAGAAAGAGRRHRRQRRPGRPAGDRRGGPGGRAEPGARGRQLRPAGPGHL
ncbi:MAG: FIG022199: FAD-binding protein, partial [uncultured Corynebacteriales bacterium]